MKMILEEMGLALVYIIMALLMLQVLVNILSEVSI